MRLRRILRLPAQPAIGTVQSVAFSPDGRWLVAATATTDQNGRTPVVVVWPASGDGIGNATRVTGLTTGATSLAFSPDSRHLAIGDPQGTVVVLPVDPVDGVVATPTSTLDGDGIGEVERLSYAPDGKRLAVTYIDPSLVGTTHVWNVPDNRDVVAFPGRHSAFAPRGDTIASISGTQQVVLRNGRTYAPITTLTTVGPASFVDLSYRADGRAVLLASNVGGAGVWTADLGTGQVTPVEGSVPGSTIAAETGGMVATDTGIMTASGTVSPRPLAISARSVAFRPGSDGVYAIGGHWVDPGLSGAVVLMDSGPSPTTGHVLDYRGTGRSLLSPDGRSAAMTGAGGVVRVIATGDDSGPGPTLQPGVLTPTDLAFSPQGTLLAGVNGRQLTVWTLADGKAFTTLQPVQAPSMDAAPAGLAFSPDGKSLAVPRTNGQLSVLSTDVLPPAPVTTLDLGVGAADVAYSPDGKLLAVATATGIQLWDTSSWQRVRILPGGATVLDWADSKQLVASDGESLLAWDTGGNTAHTFANPDTGHASITELATQGGMLAVATDAGDLGLWDLATGTRLSTVLGAPAPTTSLSFNGKTLSAAGPTIVEWSTDPDYWLGWICGVVQRNLTAAEWDTYGNGQPRPHTCAQFPLD
jgi:WD40 repeat protein